MQLPGRSRREALTRRGQGRHRPRRRGTGGAGLRGRVAVPCVGGGVGWFAGGRPGVQRSVRRRGPLRGAADSPGLGPLGALRWVRNVVGTDKVYRALLNAKESEAWW
jgi:hypothetical protein